MLYRIKTLRKVVLPALKKFSFDFWMRHPWVKGQKTFLNSFNHKGYWYHRANRERRTMDLFAAIIQPGGVVVEVGGHIGFISQYFRDIVGEGGVVYVFEPGSNNLPYIRRNILEGADKYVDRSVVLVEAAVGERSGVVDFYEDNLTGQNNSVVKNFEGFAKNKALSYVEASTNKRAVDLVSLDGYFFDKSIDFIKIDIEGYEWSALQGARGIISRDKPALMVEVQASHEEIFEFFEENGYLLFNEGLEILRRSCDLVGNTFCLHEDAHRQLISNFFSETSSQLR